MDIKYKFSKERTPSTYKRIDEEDNNDIFLGYDHIGNSAILIIVDGKAISIESSKCINVSIYDRGNNKIAILFSLMESDKEQIFYKFCEDMIECLISRRGKKSINTIIKRWNEWRTMFTRSSTSLLNENQVMGLLGELIFLNHYMINKYGSEKSINSWGGPSKAHKDFEIDDIWYEVKAIRTNALTVKISSIQQLDSDIKGNLEVVFLEKTNGEVSDKITLNKYIECIIDKLSPNDVRKFILKLNKVGYSYDSGYDNYNYRYIKRNTYTVEGEFPRLLSEKLLTGIVKVSYDISLTDIKKFLKEVN